MRRIALIVAPWIAACSTVPATEPELPHTCRQEGLDTFVGRAATAEVGAEILRRSGAKTLRWIPRGAAITMDLRSDRVNIRLDPQNRIESVTCG
jgi:peptidase inhibitor I78 family protein